MNNNNKNNITGINDIIDHQADDRADRPSWLTESCPAWCAGQHAESDFPDDRAHSSDTPSVPVIRTDHVLQGDAVRHCIAAADFEVVRRRGINGDGDEWIYVGDGIGTGQHLEITVESARRLARALATLLND